ncbi:MAG: SdrD B-like domain-containing protein [Acidimicrobiia bacterium]
MIHLKGRTRQSPWMIALVVLLIIGMLPLLSAPPAVADSHPQLRAVPWDGCEPPCSYLSGINGWENETDKFRFRVEVVSAHEPVDIEWSGKTVSGNPASGELPADALVGGALVDTQTTVVGGTTFEWNPGEDTGSIEVNCYYPFSGNTSTGNCYWITITATDSLGQATSVDVYLRVIEDLNPPTVEILDMSPADGTVAIGETISFTVIGTDTDIPTARFMKYYLLGGPEDGAPGATIGEDSGEFSWTPTAGQDGSYLIPVRVEEFDPLLPQDQLSTGIAEVAVVVGTGNRPPIVEIDTTVINVEAGGLVETSFSYWDQDYPYQDLTVGLVGAPPGADLYPSDFPDTLVWPTTAADDGQRFDFSLEVSDGVDTTAVPITVIVGTVSTIQISITESVGVTDTVSVTPPLLIQITESVGVSDDVDVAGPVLIQITELVGVSDAVAVLPPVQISITETVSVSDVVTTTPSVFISISESVGVSDGIAVTPPVLITIVESVGVSDTVTVTPSALGSISGTKWDDLNGDATRDSGEPPLAGVTIYLDLDDDGTPDLGEPSTVTAADGRYSFSSLIAGLFVVREVVPSGYTQTFPSVAQNGEHRVTISGSDTVIDVDFGNRLAATPTPVIQPIDDVNVEVGEFVEIGFVLEGDPDPSLYAHMWEGYPPTAVINGVIPYTPPPEDAGKTFFVTLTVSAIDDPTNFDTETFTITVNEFNPPATIAPIDDVFTLPGDEIVVTPDVNDPDGDPYTLAWEGGPPNAVINGIYILNPTSDQAGKAFPIVATVLQGGEPVATEVFTIFVGGDPEVPAGAPQIPSEGVAGDPIEVSAASLLPGSQAGIFLFSDPLLLKTMTVGPDGTFSTTVQLPLGTSGGRHSVVVMGTSESGEPITLAADLNVIDDQDEDGLTEVEETLTGTSRTNPDTDGDGVVDGIDVTWLDEYVASQPNGAFKSRFAKIRLRLRIAMVGAAIRFGDRQSALDLIGSLERRADGCGSSADRTDWITDCETQAEFNELLGLLKRNVAVMDLPDPPFWWE